MSRLNDEILNRLGDECYMCFLQMNDPQFKQSVFDELCKMQISPTLWRFVENHYNKIILSGHSHVMNGNGEIFHSSHIGDKPLIDKYLYNYVFWSMEVPV